MAQNYKQLIHVTMTLDAAERTIKMAGGAASALEISSDEWPGTETAMRHQEQAEWLRWLAGRTEIAIRESTTPIEGRTHGR